MNLPPTFFYNLFKENIFFIIDKTVFNPKPIYNSKGVLFVGKKKFGINEGLTLSKLEDIYFSNNDSALKSYGNELLKDILANEKEIIKDYHELGEELELVEFVLNNLLKKKGAEKNKAQILKIKEKDSSLINHLFCYDCFVRKSRLYSLNKGKKDFCSVKVNNQYYSIGESLEFDLDEFEKRYLKSIGKKIYEKLTKGQESLLGKIEKLKEKKELIDIIKKEEYFDDKENIGFKKDSKGFFITTKARPGSYVLYEPRNKKYYRFEEALIGVKLVKQDGKLCWREPVVINPYIHPALPSKKPVLHQKICEGQFDYNKAVQEKSLESAIRILLGEGRRLILSGYYGMNGAHFDLTSKHFQRLEVKNFDPKEVTNKYEKQ